MGNETPTPPIDPIGQATVMLNIAVSGGDVAAVHYNLPIVMAAQRQPLPALLTDLLHQAVEWDRVEVAQFLIQQGAPVDGRDDEGATPLIRAVRECRIHIPMVQMLLEAGADADAQHNGYSVIDYAESADVPEPMRVEALELLWKAPRR